MDMREKIARAICEADGCDPDHLEPGDDPYQNDEPVIDGRNRKGEPCHLFWRRYDRIFVDAVLDAMMEPTEEMIVAGIIERHDSETPEAWKLATANIYTAMIAAARTPPEEK